MVFSTTAPVLVLLKRFSLFTRYHPQRDLTACVFIHCPRIPYVGRADGVLNDRSCARAAEAVQSVHQVSPSA